MTRTNKQLSGHPARRADQLDDAALKRAPRCQCRHGTGRCRRVARFRVSALCAVDDCGSAVRVDLACAECKTTWVAHARECVDCPRLRVAAL